MADLKELLERVKAATGPDRELDGTIGELAAAEFVKRHNWKLAKIGADYDGNNACEFYTSDGKLVEGFSYPPKGKVHRFYHVPHDVRFDRYTASMDAALALTERMLPGWMVVNLCEWEADVLRARGPWQCILKKLGTQDDMRAPKGRGDHAPTAPLAILQALITALDTNKGDGV